MAKQDSLRFGSCREFQAKWSSAPQGLHRPASLLVRARHVGRGGAGTPMCPPEPIATQSRPTPGGLSTLANSTVAPRPVHPLHSLRSEEHTSELQSHLNL